MYLAGGCATFFTSRLIGRLADKHGKVRVYRAVAAGSMLPIFMQTNMVPLPLWIVLISTTLFFVLVPGRMVPAMAIVTSAAQSRLRGTFMSMNGAIQSLASGTASFIGGTMISVSATGVVVGYDHVGYLAMLVTLAGIVFAGSIQMQTGTQTVKPAASSRQRRRP